MLVEISHASLGTQETTAKDLSAGGVFVHLKDHKIHQGAALKVKLRSSAMSNSQTSPTVDMLVAHVQDDGLGLKFKNKTAQHLWSSVERLRNELLVGRDYFQVFQRLAITHATKGVLFVQLHGRWTWPGGYLQVGTDAEQALVSHCEDALGLSIGNIEPLGARSMHFDALPEAATYVVSFTGEIDNPHISDHGPYKSSRWVNKRGDLSDLTLADTDLRDLTMKLIADPSED